MNLTMKPRPLSGDICDMIASKSLAHRAMICAAFADGATEIECNSSSKDIEATVGVIRSMGAEVTKNGNVYTVLPIKNIPDNEIEIDFGESGSAMRLILPVLGALGIKAKMITHGRLTSRPLSPLYEELASHGMTLSQQGVCPLYCSGKLDTNSFSIDGGVSSQFVSGLIFAVSVQGGGSVEVTGKFESAAYVDLTTDMLKNFGITIQRCGNTFTVLPGKITTPRKIRVESDWSNAAFWLAAGAFAPNGITLSPMNASSIQGDRAIVDILKRFGAEVAVSDDKITVRKNILKGCEIDASGIPDLVPVLSVVAAAAQGDTVIDGIARLRFKESDRVATVCEMLENLGIKTEAYENRLIIHGGTLRGGIVDSHNDHRIAMSAATACAVCEGEITILDAGSVAKSYPDFFEQAEKAGAEINYHKED